MKFSYKVSLIRVSIIAIFVSIVPAGIAAADEPGWIKTGDPTVDILEANIPSSRKLSVNGVVCDGQTPQPFISTDGPYMRSEEICTAPTAYGWMGWGYIRPKADDAFAPLLAYGRLATSVMYPGSNGYMEYEDIATDEPGTQMLHYYRDASTLFEKVNDTARPWEPYYYKVNRAPDTTLHWQDGSTLALKSYSFSNNGEWLVGLTQGELIRLRIDTMKIDVLAQSGGYSGFLAISNDGRYTAYSGSSASPLGRSLVVTDNSMCTDLDPTTDRNVLTNCSARDYMEYFASQVASDFSIATLRFNDNGSTLMMHARANGTLNYYAMTPPTQDLVVLDYLALGDSFASGEGDTQNNPVTGKRYYLPGTDQEANPVSGAPREKCHLSSRSYSFLLKDAMNLSESNFNSIACSGSTMNDLTNTDDGTGDSGGYRGRFGQYKDVSSKDEVKAIKAEALDRFIPGRAAQIQFLAKYKPHAATVSVGGNDVGFADKLTECVESVGSDCSYALPGKDRTQVGREIRNIFGGLVTTYQKLHDASPHTKLYVVGYPLFVNQDNNVCSSNIHMSKNERVFVNQSTQYLNSVVAAAALKVGLPFIDVRDAFDGHELCGNGNPFVTGLARGDDTASVPFVGNTISQESYHPNSLGHQALANKIKEYIAPDTLVTAPNCPLASYICYNSEAAAPELPDYFSGTEVNEPIPTRRDFTNTDSLQKGPDTPLRLELYQGNLLPNTETKIELHSDPTVIATLMTNSDGVLDGNVILPAQVPAGQHTIHLIGKSATNQPVDFYAPLVVAGVTGDMDEDGIPDAQDACLFIDAAHQDVDGDGEDDACDGSIDLPPYNNLYRARNGNSTRLDSAIKQNFRANNPTTKVENPKRVYIERNVQNARQLGLYNGTEDYDPDGDGWALVSRSAGNDPDEDGIGGTNGAVAKVTTVSDPTKQGFVGYPPTISLRTAKAGCVMIQPQILSVVTANDKPADRQPHILALDTNSCRTSPPTEDTDGDGAADNVQQLYRARNGDPSKYEKDNQASPEDSTKIYIERNIIAAEAQIGKSDYDANGDGWALVGKSSGTAQQGVFNKFIVISGAPIASFISKKNECKFLSPVSLATVKKGEARILQPYSAASDILCQ